MKHRTSNLLIFIWKDPMTAYLLKKNIQHETIAALHKHGFDSPDSLKLLTDDDIQELNVVKGQARLLKVAVTGNCHFIGSVKSI